MGSNQQRFDALVALFLKGEYRITQRASWPLSNIAIAKPQLIKKHLPSIVKKLDQPNLHNAVKRNTVKLLQEITIPKALQGKVMHLCFNFIEDPKEAVAVKAFSLTVLEKLSKEYPEILPEIRLIINARWDNETPAFRHRAKNMR